MNRWYANLLGVTLALSQNLCWGDSWVFRPSYYSHDPVTHVRIGRQYANGPIFTRPEGAYVQGGYRYLRSTINVGGQTVDQLNHWESWGQTGQQF